MALYGDFIVKGQDQVSFCWSQFEESPLLCSESLNKTVGWPEELGLVTTASTDPS